MDIYKETHETWNKVALAYQYKFMDLDLYDKTYDFICAALKDKARILETGCGPGNIARYLLSKRPDFAIHGIDVSPNMIELAKKNNPSAHFTVMDARQIHELEGKFDGIICGFCLPYLSPADSAKLLKDAYNLLSNEGLLYLSFVEGDPAQSGFMAGSSGDRTYFHYYEMKSINELLIKEGFEQPEVFKINYPRKKECTEIHTILISKKKNRQMEVV